MNSIVNALRNHRQAVKRQQDHAASLVRDDVPARTFEVEVVEQMIADNADSFYHADAEIEGEHCENPIGCPVCSIAAADDYPEAA